VSEVKKPSFDGWLLMAVLALSAIGLVMVYSSSAILAHERTGDSFYFLKKQLVAAGAGWLALVLGLKLGYRRLARLAYPLLLLAIALMVLVLVPGIGVKAGGAYRWMRLGAFSFQPSEFAKLVWVIYLAYSLAKKREKVRSFSIGFLPHLLLAGLLVGLCMLEPDFGSSVALLFLMFVMLFAAGTKLSYLVGSVLLAIPFAYHAIISSPYRYQRIMSFLDPWANRQGAGYQVAESLMSVGSGGLWGLGLGEGRQKLFFLPEAHSDFVFAILGEELGLWGITLVILLYAIVVWRGIRIALKAAEPFGCYVALGITALFAFHAVVNMSVVLGLLPTKGLTLPFISYGGSSLMVCLAATGILLSIAPSTERQQQKSGVAVRRPKPSPRVAEVPL